MPSISMSGMPSPSTAKKPHSPTGLRRASSTGRFAQGVAQLGGFLLNQAAWAPAAPAPAATAAPSESNGALDALVHQLAVMAQSPHMNDTLVSLGFCRPLVNMIETCPETVRITACRALAHLGSRREHIPVLYESGAVGALLNMLDDGTSPAEPTSTALSLGVLEALRPLSRGDTRARASLQDLKSIMILMRPLGAACLPGATDEAKAVAQAALGVLRNLSASSGSQELFRTAGVIKQLVAILDALPHATFPTAAARAATVLSNLAVGNAANKERVRKDGAILRLVKLLESSTAEVRQSATEALGTLAVKNSTNKDAIREAGGVRALAELYKAAAGVPRGRGVHTSGRTASPLSSSPPSTSPRSFKSPSSSKPASRQASRPTSRSTSPVSNSPLTASPASSKPNSRPSSRPLSPRHFEPTSTARGIHAPPPPLLLAACADAALLSQGHFVRAASWGVTPPATPPLTSASSEEPVPMPISMPLLTPQDGLLTPPETARTSHGDRPSHGEGAAGGASTPPATERILWALRNLINANGLNSAVVVACGLPVSEIEGRHTAAKREGGAEAGGKAKAKEPAPPPPPRPAMLPLAGGDEDDGETPPHLSGATGGAGMTMFARTGRAV